MYAIQTVAVFSLDCLGKRQVGSHDHIHFQLDLQWSSNHDDDLCRLPHYFVSVLWGSAVAITWRFAITPVQLRLWLSPAWPRRALRQYPRDYMWLMIRDLWVGVIHTVRRTSAPLPPMDGVPLYLTVLWLIHIIQQLVSKKKKIHWKSRYSHLLSNHEASDDSWVTWWTPPCWTAETPDSMHHSASQLFARRRTGRSHLFWWSQLLNETTQIIICCHLLLSNNKWPLRKCSSAKAPRPLLLGWLSPTPASHIAAELVFNTTAFARVWHFPIFAHVVAQQPLY